MQYGLSVANTDMFGDVRALAELMHQAEAVGWDGVFLEDYIIYQGSRDAPTYDPWVAMAAIAMRTERMRIGTAVTPLPRRRPWKVAREAMTLDHLSGGRFILGVGMGDVNDVGFTHFGEVTDAKARAGMLDEALDVLVGLLSGQPFAYQGVHYQVDEVTFQPAPVRPGGIPIWIGGGWPRKALARRAARLDGACPYKIGAESEYESEGMTPADIRALKAAIAAQRTRSAPFDIINGGETPGDDPAQAGAILAPLAEAGVTWWTEFVGSYRGDGDAMRARILQGPPRID
jgi:alkanesulfonate monooxygenase SsuD/methylene tetrahydromethanopterin reductase-like flavin-dependent oxidoreductase (luciferase family)